MPKVTTDKLKPGMKLAKSVANDAGMVLIGEGTELTDAHIRRLEAMNVAAVQIQGEAGSEKPVAERIAELDARFAKTADAPNMAMIRNLFRKHIEETGA